MQFMANIHVHGMHAVQQAPFTTFLLCNKTRSADLSTVQ